MDIVSTLLKKNLINEAHIQFLERTKVEPNNFYKYYELKHTIDSESVEVSKIRGLGMRGECGESWADHISFSVGTLSKKRINDFINDNNLLEKTRGEINELFSSENFIRFRDNVKLNYYKEEDVYFVSNGNHRTMLAKLFNVSHIRAEVSVHKLSEKSYGNYKRYKEMKHQLFNLVDEIGCTLKKRENIIHVDFDVYYEEVYVYSFTCEDWMTFSDTSKLNGLINGFEEAMGFLLKFSNKVNFYKRMPKCVRLHMYNVSSFLGGSSQEFEDITMKRIIKNSRG